MNKTTFYKQELEETEFMTILSEKRTILSEIRTWITMVLLPISIFTALIALSKSFNFSQYPIYLVIAIISILLILFILFFIIKNIKQLLYLNKKIGKFNKKNL